MWENSTRQKPYRGPPTWHFLPKGRKFLPRSVVNFAGYHSPRKEERREAFASPALPMSGTGSVASELLEERENDLRLLVCDCQCLHAELLLDL